MTITLTIDQRSNLTAWHGQRSLPAMPAVRQSLLSFIEKDILSCPWSEEPFFELAKKTKNHQSKGNQRRKTESEKNSRMSNVRVMNTINLAHRMLDEVWPLTDATQRAQKSKMRHAALMIYKRILYEVLTDYLEKCKQSSEVLNEDRSGKKNKSNIPCNANTICDKDKLVDSLLVNDPEILRGLMNSCIEIVDIAYGLGNRGDLIAITRQIGRGNKTFELWLGLHWFGKYLFVVDPSDPGFIYLSIVKERIICHLAFSEGSSIFGRLVMAWNYTFEFFVNYKAVEEFLRELAVTAEAITAKLCLAIAKHSLELDSTESGMDLVLYLATATTHAVCTIIYSHLDTIFNSDLSILIAGCLYLTAKLHSIHGIRLNFLSNLLMASTPGLDETTFRFISLRPIYSSNFQNQIVTEEYCPLEIDHNVNSNKNYDMMNVSKESQTRIGTLRQYYNEILLPLYHKIGDATLYGASHERLHQAVIRISMAYNASYEGEAKRIANIPLEQETEDTISFHSGKSHSSVFYGSSQYCRSRIRK